MIVEMQITREEAQGRRYRFKWSCEGGFFEKATHEQLK
jgi:hypothetical protein